MRHGSTSSQGWADLDCLLIALYVTIDDLLGRPGRLPGRKPKLSDSELACLAVAQVLLACPSEHRWLRFAMVRLGHLFPYLPQQPGYNKRLRALSPILSRVLRHLAQQTPSWCDRLRLLDATSLPCASSRETVERSALRGHANYGYCASHSRYFWGFKLYLLTTPDGLVVDWCLADPKLGEAEVAEALLDGSPLEEGQIIVCDKGFADRFLQARVAELGATLLRPDRKDEPARYGSLGRSASGSRASSTPSRDSSRSKSTAGVHRPGLSRGSPSGCWRSGPGSGGTGRSAPPRSVLWLPMTTELPSDLSESVI